MSINFSGNFNNLHIRNTPENWDSKTFSLYFINLEKHSSVFSIFFRCHEENKITLNLLLSNKIGNKFSIQTKHLMFRTWVINNWSLQRIYTLFTLEYTYILKIQNYTRTIRECIEFLRFIVMSNKESISASRTHTDFDLSWKI